MRARDVTATTPAEREAVLATVADCSASYGLSWRVSGLLAETRRLLACAEGAALDGLGSDAATEAAAVALALAIRLAARVPS